MELFVWFFLIGVALWSAWHTFDLKAKWHYRQMNTLQKIEYISQKINQESDVDKQKMLLERVKLLAEKYRVEQEKIVHPDMPKLDKMISENVYKPWVRAAIIFIIAVTLLSVLPTIETETPFINVLNDYLGNTGTFALLSSPIAFFIWYYRDLNNYKERETAHRDVMFKEHKQLVEWATTETKPEDSNSTATQTTEINPPMIQVAGIYQLAPFLKDHHANLYQRSTLETLRAIVNAGRPKWDKWVVQYEYWIANGKERRMPEKPQLTAAERAVHAVLRENPVLFYHKNFNAKDFNLAGFDGRGLVLIGCNLEDSRFECSLFNSSNLSNTCLANARLTGANLEQVNLRQASLINACLLSVYLGEFSDLSQTCLVRADMRCLVVNNNTSKFNGVNFLGAVVSEPNIVDWDQINFLKFAINKGALSIADRKISIFDYYGSFKESNRYAIEQLKAKGLTPTTQASLAAESKEIS